MTIRHRAVRTAALTTALVAATFGLSAAGAAQALSPRSADAPTAAGRQAAGPSFLAEDELPPSLDSPWHAGEVTAGLPEYGVFCLEGVLAAADAEHRTYRTDLDASAHQVTVRARTAKAARALAARAETSVRNCPAAFQEQYPGGEAELTDLGDVDVQEGAHVHAVDTAHPDGATDIHLFGIGRDGRTVTVVAWGSMGDLAQAPTEGFRGTVRTAVEKLYR